MSNEPNSNSPGPDPSGEGKPDSGLIAGHVRHRQISARVPEAVSRGVFSTGAIVLVGGNEFIVDFLLRMARPHQIVSRVVLPHAVMPQLIATLRANLGKYRARFGEPPALPAPPADAPKPSIQEIYDDLKMPDDLLAGAYSNGVMISHSASEFCFDFITNFFPHSCVSSRIYISAPQVPRLLDAFVNTFNEFQRRVAQLQQQQQRLQAQQQVIKPSPASGNEFLAMPPQASTDATSRDPQPPARPDEPPADAEPDKA
jgi:hypothetical protein